MMPGSSEWLIILGVALLIFGPSKLPQLGGAVGESIRNFRKGMKGLENETNAPLSQQAKQEITQTMPSKRLTGSQAQQEQ